MDEKQLQVWCSYFLLNRLINPFLQKYFGAELHRRQTEGRKKQIEADTQNLSELRYFIVNDSWYLFSFSRSFPTSLPFLFLSHAYFFFPKKLRAEHDALEEQHDELFASYNKKVALNKRIEEEIQKLNDLETPEVQRPPLSFFILIF